MAEAITVLKSLLISNWTADNTDEITPEIELVYDVFSRDFGVETTYVRIHTRNEEDEFHHTGSSNLNEVERVSIMISTMHSRSHMLNCVNEVKRILKENYCLNDPDVHFVQVTGATEHSDKKRKIWEKTIECEVRRWNK